MFNPDLSSDLNVFVEAYCRCLHQCVSKNPSLPFQRLYFGLDIPINKLKPVKTYYAPGYVGHPLILVDTTLLRSCKEGYLLTDLGFYFCLTNIKTGLKQKDKMPISKLVSLDVCREEKNLSIDGVSFHAKNLDTQEFVILKDFLSRWQSRNLNITKEQVELVLMPERHSRSLNEINISKQRDDFFYRPQINPDKVKNLRRIAFLLDNSIPIPGTNYRFGLDPILGLLGIAGGTGDIVGGALGVYIVAEAARMGLPQNLIWQMVGNILVDSLVGVIPGLGDIFDVTWKANARNIALLDQYLNIAPQKRKSNPLFVIGITIILVIIVLGFAVLTITIINSIFQL